MKAKYENYDIKRQTIDSLKIMFIDRFLALSFEIQIKHIKFYDVIEVFLPIKIKAPGY